MKRGFSQAEQQVRKLSLFVTGNLQILYKLLDRGACTNKPHSNNKCISLNQIFSSLTVTPIKQKCLILQGNFFLLQDFILKTAFVFKIFMKKI